MLTASAGIQDYFHRIEVLICEDSEKFIIHDHGNLVGGRESTHNMRAVVAGSEAHTNHNPVGEDVLNEIRGGMLDNGNHRESLSIHAR